MTVAPSPVKRGLKFALVAFLAGAAVLLVIAVAAWVVREQRRSRSRMAPVIVVSVSMSGAPPAGIEAELIEPIEQAIASLPLVARMESSCREGSGSVTLTPREGRIEDVLLAVNERIGARAASLPQSADLPIVERVSPSSTVLVLALSDADPILARQLADEQVRRRLERISGVTAVRVTGGASRRTIVQVDPARLTAVGASIVQVADAVAMPGMPEVPPEALLELPIGSGRLRDVAQVVESPAPDGFAFEGKTGVALVEVQSNLATRAHLDEQALQAAVREVQLSLPPSVRLRVLERRALRATSEAGSAEVSVQTPPGISEERRAQLVQRVARALEATALGATYAAAREDGSAAVVLVASKPLDAGAARKTVLKALASVPAVRTRVTLRCGVDPCAGSGSDGELQLVLSGPDLDALAAISAKLEALLQTAPGVEAVDRESPELEPATEVRVDRARALELGVALSDVNRAVGLATGAARGQGGVVIRVGEGEAPAEEMISRLRVPSRALGLVELSQLVRVEQLARVETILRINGERAARLRVRFGEGSSRDRERVLQGAIDQLKLPAGYRVEVSD